MHIAEELGLDEVQAGRSPDKKSAEPQFLRACSCCGKGGFHDDGRFEDLNAVVNHYDHILRLGLNPVETADLIECLKCL